jgi:ABC-type polysaccharide/polyol phosphate transport system ATPase subunit
VASIQVDNLELVFRRCQAGRRTLKEILLGGWRSPQVEQSGGEVAALHDVTFRVGEAERLGVIGHNGAGKSTLLRVLAGIYRPTRGVCRVNGRLSNLFDISLGFEPDATGWQNILYRGYLQRESPRSICSKMADIAEFSGLGQSLDMPVRYYSSGMLVRLAFAISTAIEPEILLVDEVLSAGDLGFQEKARQRMRELIGRARLMVLVSHDLAALAQMCDRVLWLDHGKVRQLGAPAPTIAAYRNFMLGAAAA